MTDRPYPGPAVFAMNCAMPRCAGTVAQIRRIRPETPARIGAVRLLLYNIRYAMGPGTSARWNLPGMGYVLGNRSNLKRITEFIKSQDPDVVGLVEVDTGSIRAQRVNQAETIGHALGHYSVYQCKYGETSLNHLLPIVRKQGNAFLAAPRVHGERFHYFDKGIKRLTIELELEECLIFLVHLSLKYRQIGSAHV